MLMKKFAITVTSIFKKIITFVTKVLGMFKFSITFKMPFINVTLVLSIFHPSNWRGFVLSTSGIAEQLRLIFGSNDLQKITLVTALVKAGSSLGEFDEVILHLLDLQHVHKLAGIDVAGIEQEVMCGNRKQRLRKLTNTADEEVLDVLRCEDDGRILFTDTLGGVTDILDGGHVRQEQVQLVDGCYRVAMR